MNKYKIIEKDAVDNLTDGSTIIFAESHQDAARSYITQKEWNDAHFPVAAGEADLWVWVWCTDENPEDQEGVLIQIDRDPYPSYRVIIQQSKS